MNFNSNFNDLKENYLFAEVAARAKKYSLENPDKKLLKLGIGDVTLPLAPAVIAALHSAVDDMARRETFKGYGPYEGYGFLRESISAYYKKMGADIGADEIFISDGAESHLGNLLDIFSLNNTVLVPDPVYPVYEDTNIMAGRKVVFANADEGNGFLPMPDYSVKADIIYICSPNNPTGAAYTKAQLKEWVDYANKLGAVILYDAAYECFISDESKARSIFQVEGSRTCAIEICSFSKIAGFTGTRCGYSVVPKQLERSGMNANKTWFRRQATKFNGVPYIIQKGAAAVYTEQGQKEIKANINYYLQNAKIIADCMDRLNNKYTGGKNSPYIWLKCPDGLKSWEFFDVLLNGAQVVGTPGAGFGKNGEGFFRLTSFGSREVTEEATDRIYNLLKK